MSLRPAPSPPLVLILPALSWPCGDLLLTGFWGLSSLLSCQGSWLGFLSPGVQQVQAWAGWGRRRNRCCCSPDSQTLTSIHSCPAGKRRKCRRPRGIGRHGRSLQQVENTLCESQNKTGSNVSKSQAMKLYQWFALHH